MHLLSHIQSHLRRTGMPPTRFGREAVNDPRLIRDLENGREPSEAMCRRVLSWIESREVAR